MSNEIALKRNFLLIGTLENSLHHDLIDNALHRLSTITFLNLGSDFICETTRLSRRLEAPTDTVKT